jgi:3-isopropylmalate/(R)-2-methylmalate dehydratase small subunit
MKPTVRIESKSVVLPQTDVDTDQIIPARFLTTTTKTGLGTHLFAEWRYAKDGTLREDFALNQVPVASHAILVAGHNFGCGSSREHAPWALLDYGLRAVISTEIADIFRANSLKNGFLPIVVDAATHKWLVSFPIDRFSRYCLINGIDQLGFLLENADAITEFERRSA